MVVWLLRALVASLPQPLCRTPPRELRVHLGGRVRHRGGRRGVVPEELGRAGGVSRRRDCHYAAPPSIFKCAADLLDGVLALPDVLEVLEQQRDEEVEEDEVRDDEEDEHEGQDLKAEHRDG